MGLKIKRISVYASLAGFWLAVHFAFVAVVAFIDVERETQGFTETAASLYGELVSQARSDRDALWNFGAFVETQGIGNREIASGYARRILAANPRLRLLGVAREPEGVAPNDWLAACSVPLLAKAGEFGSDAAEPGLASPGPALVFAESGDNGEPAGSELDFAAYPRLAELLRRARANPAAVASLSLRRAGREDIRVLARRVADGSGESFVVALAQPYRLAARNAGPRPPMVILRESERGQSTTSRILLNAASPPASRLEAAIFPLLKFQGTLEAPPLATTVAIERQLDGSILDRERLGVVFGLAGLFLVIFIGHAKALYRQEQSTLEEGNKLFQRANFDALTGLPNRQLFANRLDQALTTARRTGEQHALLFLDLDGFKQINDFYGHEIGDKVLQRAARIFQRRVRDVDTVARLGGDEFAILLYGVAGRVNAEMVARKIKKAFCRHPNELDNINKPLPKIGTSVGIAIYPEDGETGQELLRAADQAMYRDKAVGKSPPATTAPALANRA